MNTRTRRILYWAPRILCILYAAFLSLFAFDVFGGGLTAREAILALLIHLIPVYFVIVALAVAWRWEGVGAILFGALAAGYMVWSWGRFPWSAYATISGPLVLVGVLFLLNWIYRVRRRS